MNDNHCQSRILWEPNKMAECWKKFCQLKRFSLSWEVTDIHPGLRGLAIPHDGRWNFGQWNDEQIVLHFYACASVQMQRFQRAWGVVSLKLPQLYGSCVLPLCLFFLLFCFAMRRETFFFLVFLFGATTLGYKYFLFVTFSFMFFSFFKFVFV